MSPSCDNNAPDLHKTIHLATQQRDQTCPESYSAESDKTTRVLTDNDIMAKSPTTRAMPDAMSLSQPALRNLGSCSQSHTTAARLSEPLLKQFPGREISGAKTDGRAWAADYAEADILEYPDDVSSDEFYIHPLVQFLALSASEQARLGLIIPRELKSRDIFYEYDTDDDNSSLPPCTSRASTRSASSSTSSFGVLSKVRSWTRHRSHSKTAVAGFHADTRGASGCSTHTKASSGDDITSTRPGLHIVRSTSSLRTRLPSTGTTRLQTKRSKGLVNTQVAFPLNSLEPSLESVNLRNDPDTTSSSSYRAVRSEIDIGNAATQLGEHSFHLFSGSGSIRAQAPSVTSAAFFCRLAPPRLSPMEYLRMYLVDKAVAEREGRETEMQRPSLKRVYSENHEKFFILPRIPSAVSREVASDLKHNRFIDRPSVARVGPDLDEGLSSTDSVLRCRMNIAAPRAHHEQASDDVLDPVHSLWRPASSADLRQNTNNSGNKPNDGHSITGTNSTCSFSEISAPDQAVDGDAPQDDDMSHHSGNSVITSFHLGEPVRHGVSHPGHSISQTGCIPDDREDVGLPARRLATTSSDENVHADNLHDDDSKPGKPHADRGCRIEDLHIAAVSNGQLPIPQKEILSTPPRHMPPPVPGQINDSANTTIRTADLRQRLPANERSKMIPKVSNSSGPLGLQAASVWGPPPTPPPSRPLPPLPPLPAVRRLSPLRMSMLIPQPPLLDTQSHMNTNLDVVSVAA